MLLSELTTALDDVRLTGDAEVSGICFDSHRVAPGHLFVALSGAKVDGHRFIPQAVSAGAAAVMVEREAADIHVPQLVVSDTRMPE